MDPILAGMTISILRWEEAESAQVIDFFSARHRIRQKRAAQWLRTYTRPMPPNSGDAA